MPTHFLTIVLSTFLYTSTATARFWYRNEIATQMRFVEIITEEIVNKLQLKSTKEISKIDFIIVQDIHFDEIETKGVIVIR